MTDPDGTTRDLTLLQSRKQSNRYEAELRQLAEGDYRLSLSTAGFDSSFVECGFSVQEETREMEVLNQQKDPLIQMATNSGGFYVDISDMDQVWTRLPQGGWNQAGSESASTIWSWWFVPMLFATSVIGLICAEWILRRKLGLE